MTSIVRNNSVEELRKVSKLHETNLVIELGIDRIVTWIGVYFIFILGFLMEVEQFFESGRGLACFPENSTKSFSKSDAELAAFNCWEITSTENYANHCLKKNTTSDKQSDYAKLDDIKIIIKLLPLLMIFMAFLTSLSTVWWHFNFGSRLLAHLKLIQFLLDKICEVISKNKKVKYISRPYDSNSFHLIGKMPFCNPCIELALTQIRNTSDWLMNLDESFNNKDLPSVTFVFDKIQEMFDFQETQIEVTKAQIEVTKKMCITAQEMLCEVETKIDNFYVTNRFRRNNELCKTFRDKTKKLLKEEKHLSRMTQRWLSELFSRDYVWKILNPPKFTNLLNQTLPKKIIRVKELLLKNKDVAMEQQSDLIQWTCEYFERKIAIFANIEKGQTTLYNCMRLLVDKTPKLKESELLLDRHFLSLLCYENFASLYYIPYIYLVFGVYRLQLSERIVDKEKPYNNKKELNKIGILAKTIPTEEATLRSWCHPDNLTARELVSNYRKKQIFTISIAFLGILIFGSVFVIFRILVNSNSQNLHCALPHMCFICSLLRETRLYILIGTACFSYVVAFCLLCHQVVNLNKRIQTNDCHLFELLQDLSMDALIEEPSEKAAEKSSAIRFGNEETAEVVSQASIDHGYEMGDTANNAEEQPTTSTGFQTSGKSSFNNASQPVEKPPILSIPTEQNLNLPPLMIPTQKSPEIGNLNDTKV